MNANDPIPAWVDGVLTPADKLEVHRRGWRHKAVSVFVNCGEWTLIQRRALGKYHTPGLWANACCTHPRWGEDPAACAARRLGEELNLTGLSPRPTGRIDYRADVGGGMVEDEAVDVFVAEAPERLQVRPNPEEVMDTAWIRFQDLAARAKASPEIFTPWIRIYLAGHMPKIGGL